MKKVILAFDGEHFSEGAFEFARRLNQIEPILLTGIFLPIVQYANLYGYAEGSAGPIFVPVIEGGDSALVSKNIERFKDHCIYNDIDFRVHNDKDDFALPELRRETRFADLLILGSEKFYENLGTDKPNGYLTEILHVTECPVVVVPEKFVFPRVNILTYDGSKPSVFAIKQFAYLFPELCLNKSIVITTVADEDKDIPQKENIRELASVHYPDLEIMKVEFDHKRYFSTWVSEKPGGIVIAGAFGRSFLSQLFKSSFMAQVISEHGLPVFIAHD